MRNTALTVKESKRVLHVVRHLRGFEGITSHLVTLSQALQQQGWEIGLASGLDECPKNHRGTPDWFKQQGIQHFKAHFPDFKPRLSLPKQGFQSFFELNQIVKDFQPDIIHIHSLSVCFYARLISTIHKVPLISTCHMEIRRDQPKVSSLLYSQYLAPFLGDRVIALSSELKDSFLDIFKVKENKVRLIYHGVNDNYFHPPSDEECINAKTSLGVPDSSRVVCIVGRLAPAKGHSVLFKAIQKLKSEGIEVYVLCAGTGDMLSSLEQLAAELGISKLVKFLGFLDSRQVIWASDALVLPSYREAFGLVVIEAMLCRVIPLRTPAPGAADQIDSGNTGFTFPFDDHHTLAGQLKTIFENHQYKKKVAEAAFTYSRENFSLKRMGWDTLNVYSEAMQSTF